MCGKMEVLYYGNVWLSNLWINRSTFGGYKVLHGHEKTLINREGSTLNVEIRYLEIPPETKKERRSEND